MAEALLFQPNIPQVLDIVKAVRGNHFSVFIRRVLFPPIEELFRVMRSQFEALGENSQINVIEAEVLSVQGHVEHFAERRVRQNEGSRRHVGGKC